jgi:hypothetical protein
MTDDQINAAIAEVCGWTDIHDSGPWHNHKLWGYPPELQGQGGNAYKYMPDYCKDLNAMHEAEKVLTTFDEWDIYCVHLGDTQPSCAKATSRQRAEAFLRTLGKWEEVQP